MDTDGTVDKRNGYTSFCNTSRALIDGVVHLVRSLGGVATVGPAKPSSYRGKPGKPHWKVSISLPLGAPPFHLSRKAAPLAGRTLRYQMRRGIVRVEACGTAPAVCIMVDHPSHLYVTDDFVVTHNTHYQRRKRIDRVGQNGPVELLDFVADHPAERAARERLARKYELRSIVTSPLEGLDDRGIAGVLQRIRAHREDAEEPLHPAALEPPLEPEPEEQRALF